MTRGFKRKFNLELTYSSLVPIGYRDNYRDNIGIKKVTGGSSFSDNHMG